jgi:hypothetical protein
LERISSFVGFIAKAVRICGRSNLAAVSVRIRGGNFVEQLDRRFVFYAKVEVFSCTPGSGNQIVVVWGIDTLLVPEMMSIASQWDPQLEILFLQRPYFAQRWSEIDFRFLPDISHLGLRTFVNEVETIPSVAAMFAGMHVSLREGGNFRAFEANRFEVMGNPFPVEIYADSDFQNPGRYRLDHEWNNKYRRLEGGAELLMIAAALGLSLEKVMFVDHCGPGETFVEVLGLYGCSIPSSLDPSALELVPRYPEMYCVLVEDEETVRQILPGGKTMRPVAVVGPKPRENQPCRVRIFDSGKDQVLREVVFGKLLDAAHVWIDDTFTNHDSPDADLVEDGDPRVVVHHGESQAEVYHWCGCGEMSAVMADVMIVNEGQISIENLASLNQRNH